MVSLQGKNGSNITKLEEWRNSENKQSLLNIGRKGIAELANWERQIRNRFLSVGLSVRLLRANKQRSMPVNMYMHTDKEACLYVCSVASKQTNKHACMYVHACMHVCIM